MTLAEIIERSAMLPPDKQEELSEFAEFLLARYAKQRSAPLQQLDDTQKFTAWLAGDIQPNRAVPIGQEAACGLWRDRTEMNDSVEYVRNLRANWRSHQP